MKKNIHSLLNLLAAISALTVIGCGGGGGGGGGSGGSGGSGGTTPVTPPSFEVPTEADLVGVPMTFTISNGETINIVFVDDFVSIRPDLNTGLSWQVSYGVNTGGDPNSKAAVMVVAQVHPEPREYDLDLTWISETEATFVAEFRENSFSGAAPLPVTGTLALTPIT